MPKSSNTQYSEKIEKAYDELQFLALLAEEKMTPKQKNQHKDVIGYTEFVLANGMTGEAGEFRGVSVENDLMEKTKANIQLRDALKGSWINVDKYVDRYMQEYESSKKNNHRYEKHYSFESNNSIQSGDSGYSKQSSNQSNSSRSSNNPTLSVNTSIGKINLGTGEDGRRTIDPKSLMEAFVKHHNKRLGDLLEGASTSNNDTKKPSHTNEHHNRRRPNQRDSGHKK